MYKRRGKRAERRKFKPVRDAHPSPSYHPSDWNPTLLYPLTVWEFHLNWEMQLQMQERPIQTPIPEAKGKEEESEASVRAGPRRSVKKGGTKTRYPTNLIIFPSWLSVSTSTNPLRPSFSLAKTSITRANCNTPRWSLLSSSRSSWCQDTHR